MTENIPPRGSIAEVFAVFLRLGLTSFGGPVAHLGFFRTELVQRRRWLDDAAYADLVALCQFLPGPASSQTGFALGLMRAGWGGALAAFVAFTLPSAVLMLAFAVLAPSLTGPFGEGLIAGLKIAAVAVVAQAVIGMARSLCPDLLRASVAVAAVAVLAFVPGAGGMVAAILAGMAAGLALGLAPAPVGATPARALPIPRALALGGAALFLGGLALLPLVAGRSDALGLADAFWRAGALVFGGGHVVLPLLEAGMVQTGRVSPEAFLAGYGAAQAVPGPLFTFAAYLGAVNGAGPAGVAGAALALAAIFAPGFLILVAALPLWSRLRQAPRARAALAGANAAVVGILGAALYDPVFTAAIADTRDLALALAALVALTLGKAPPWAVVAGCAAGGVGLAALG